MGNWKIVVPYELRNLVLNPSAERTGIGYASYGSASVSISYGGFVGSRHYSIDALSGGGIQLDLSGTHSGHMIVQVYAVLFYGNSLTLQCSLDGGTSWQTLSKVIDVYNDVWTWWIWRSDRITVNSSTTLIIRSTGNAGFGLDGVMVCPDPIPTGLPANVWLTYVDGDQDGCMWSGVPHCSDSLKPLRIRSGGVVYDLEDDFGFYVERVVSAGSVARTIVVDESALSDAKENALERLSPRRFTLVGTISGTSLNDLHAKRRRLLSVLSSRAELCIDGRPQPVRIIYVGSRPVRYTDAYYERGLDFQVSASDACGAERNVAVEFVAPDPAWYSLKESSADLLAGGWLYNPNPVSLLIRTSKGLERYCWIRAATSMGGNRQVYAVALGPDGKLYIGGDFTHVNNSPNTAYIARYNFAADTFESVGNGLNGVVRAIAFDNLGYCYVGGDFTNAGGNASANYIARVGVVPGLPTTWQALSSTTLNARVRALRYDTRNYRVYIGGDFTSVGGNANASYIVHYNGSTFGALTSTPLNGSVYAIDVSTSGTVYIGGTFTAAGSVTLNRICMWDGDNFLPLGSGLNGTVRAIAVSVNQREVYIGGSFTATAAGTSSPYIVMWNGSNYAQVGNGTNGTVHALCVAPDGTLWVGGSFTGVPGVPGMARGLARWLNGTWVHGELLLPSGVTVNAIACSGNFPTSLRHSEVYVGYNSAEIVLAPFSGNVCTDGTMPVYPRLVVAGVHTSMWGYFLGMRIGVTGKQIFANVPVRPGERLTVDLHPGRLSARTDVVPVHNVFGPASDTAEMYLIPGRPDDNMPQWVSVMLTPPTTTLSLAAYLLWRDAFDGID